MAKKTIKQPSLYLRSGYFIDCLRAQTGQGMTALERRIRESQYEANGLEPPSDELVRDYFRLYRTVAFEPRRKERIAPWLLAAEMEFPGSASAFFHPMFDLLFGQIESTVFWETELGKIPEKWIAGAEQRGDSAIAQEWQAMNTLKSGRKHRKRQHLDVAPLSFIHLSLMRLPEHIGTRLFERRGLATTWARCYSSVPSEEIEFLLSLQSFDALCALAFLTKEAAEIGDMRRYSSAKDGAMQLLPKLVEFPGCRRIGKLLHLVLLDELTNQMLPRRYSRTLHMGFGLPTSWRVMINGAELNLPIDQVTNSVDQINR